MCDISLAQRVVFMDFNNGGVASFCGLHLSFASGFSTAPILRVHLIMESIY